METIKFK